MASGSVKSDVVARRYEAALIDTAERSELIEKIEKDITDLGFMLDGSEDLQRLVCNPLISRTQQRNAVMALAEKARFQTLMASFLGVLVDNRRLRALRGIIPAFHAELRKRRGQVEAKVESAYALSPAQTKALQEQLSKAMGSYVTLNVEVNKDLLGGMVVTVGSRMIDDSVKRKLEKLQRAMSAGERAA